MSAEGLMIIAGEPGACRAWHCESLYEAAFQEEWNLGLQRRSDGCGHLRHVMVAWMSCASSPCQVHCEQAQLR